MQWQKYNNNIVSSATACFRKGGDTNHPKTPRINCKKKTGPVKFLFYHTCIMSDYGLIHVDNKCFGLTDIFALDSDDINGEQVHLRDNGILETSDGDLGNGIREAPEREDSLAATNEEDVELIRKWKNVMGPNYDIKVSSEMRV